ncbi:MAG: type II toxin-antitoxin system RelE/ParE family toxin [Verrucomicrobiota bacterium]
MNLVLSPEALSDLEELWFHIAQDDPIAADGVIDYLQLQFLKIAATPTMGRVRSDLWPDAYCYSTGRGAWRSGFLVFYRIRERSIEVARIIEGHRDISPKMFE